jgi:hypothetical protein
MFFQIARETILLLINNIHEKLTRFDRFMTNLNCYIHVLFPRLKVCKKLSKSENLHFLPSAAMLIFLPRFQAWLLFC